MSIRSSVTAISIALAMVVSSSFAMAQVRGGGPSQPSAKWSCSGKTGQCECKGTSDCAEFGKDAKCAGAIQCNERTNTCTCKYEGSKPSYGK